MVPTEHMAEINLVGLPDMCGQGYGEMAKFKHMENCYEFEINLWELVRTMLVSFSSMRMKIATSGLKFFIDDSMKTFCRKSKPIPVYPKRFNSDTVGSLGREFIHILFYLGILGNS